MLVKCAAYEEGRRVADIPPDQIHEYLARLGYFVWVALKDPDVAELEQMREEFDLHPLAVEDALHGHQRAKIEEYGDSLFAVLHTVEIVADGTQTGELAVFVGPNYVLTVRSHVERGLADVRARAEHEPDLLRHGSAFVFYALLDAVVDRYFPVLEKLESDLEAVERDIFSGDTTIVRQNLTTLYSLKQQMMTLRHATAALPEAVSKLSGGRVPSLCRGLTDYFRDVYDHLVRLNQAMDDIREMIGTAISVNLAMISLSENETMKRLASYAALIAVPTLIAGIYGMNFENMPELKWVMGYPFAMAAMAAADGYLFFRFRRAGWL